MQRTERWILDARYLLPPLTVALLALAPPCLAVMDATTECLVDFEGVADTYRSGGTIQCTDCDPSCDTDGFNTPNQSCTFKLKVCADEAEGACTAAPLKKVKVSGGCGAAALTPTPSGTSPTCGPSTNLTVKLRKHGRKAGKCKVVARAISSDRPKKVDKDVLTLVCNPQTAARCPSVQPTMCTPPPGVVCEPIVPGQPIPGTYQLLGVRGPSMCQTTSAANKFGPCSSDADCGGTQGGCLPTPWITADGIAFPFPLGIKTVFTIAAADAPPTCSHSACVQCGSAGACAGIPGCGTDPSAPQAGCIRNTCCASPGFTLPSFVVPILNFCSRLDQFACGTGVVNTSNPQTGDNEVNKQGDTSDPGPDCVYGTADDPRPKPCNTQAGGAGRDIKGKIVRTLGDGACDANGIQYRLTIPGLSTTWHDAQGCPSDATFDEGELLVSQIILQAELTTAGASGAFVDMNGDGCTRAGNGFSPELRDGPVTLGSPPAAPQPYDGSAGSIAVAAGFALSGSPPLFDIGFVAVEPNGPATVVTPPQTCSCTPVVGCPE